MKTRIILLSLFSAFAAVSCSDNLSEQLVWEDGVMATLPGYDEMAETRVTFTDSFSKFYWSNGDCIGVCHSSASSNGTAAFTLLKGGGTTGNFINDSFSLLANTDYYAFYPFTAGVTASSFPVDLEGQVQTANNEMDHLGKFNYMSTKFTTDDNGKSSFTFANIGSIIQLHFTADKEETYQSLSITSGGNPFTVRASYNLTDGTITSKSSKATFNVSFGEEGIHVYNDESVVISAVVLPEDLSQSTLTFSIKNKEGTIVKEMEFAGYAFSRGKLYHFYEEVHHGNPPYGGCPDGNHPHAIDLGLPSGTLWSCMNLGAENPLYRGFRFSWGQTACTQKNSSNWSNYEFMDETYSNEWGITKYQVADNNLSGRWYDESETFIGDKKTTLELDDDAARQNWRGAWRLPTRKEVEELLNYVAKERTFNYNGTGNLGVVVYRKKSNGVYSLWDTHIYFPHSVDANDLSFWTSSLTTDTRQAYSFTTIAEFYAGRYDGVSTMSRTGLGYIRPVQSKPGSQSVGRP